MQKFLYKAKDGRKQVMQGILEAETERGALSKLSQMGYFPLSIQKEEAGPQRQASSRSFSIFTGIRRRDITFLPGSCPICSRRG